MQNTFPPFTFLHRQFFHHERVLLAGLPFFPAEFSNEGEKIKITRSWQVESINNYANQPSKRIFIRLQPPEYRVYEKYSPNISFNTVQMLYQQRPDLEIVWLGQIKSSVYLILEQTPFDLDDEIFTQYVVRLNAPSSITIIGNNELQKLIPIIRNQIDPNFSLVLSEITPFLGTIPELNSPEYYFECIKERSFTRVLKVRWDTIPPGKSLPIRKWQRPILENLSISVPIPSDLTINEDFLVKEYLSLDNQHYLILQSERTLISGERWEAYLVKLERNSIFSLNNDLEFQRIAQLFIDSLEKPSPGNNFRLLGSITPAETELVIDYLSFTESTTSANQQIPNSNNSAIQEKTQLTNLLLIKVASSLVSENQNITFKAVEPGQKLKIHKRWRISTRLYISLSFLDQVNYMDSTIPTTLDFSTLLVESVFSFNFWYYIILLLPENMVTASNKPHFILKIQDADTLITLFDEELHKLHSIYYNSKNNSVNTIGDILALLNSLSSNESNREKKVFEDAFSKPLATKPNNKITKPHLGNVSNYHLEKTLYQNPPFTLYLVKQTNLGNREVLLKILDDEANENTANEFVKQTSMIAKLEHPNIVKIYQVGKSQGYYFASMQYIKGKDILSFLSERTFVVPMQLLIIAEQVANALDYAHQNSIFHGNISPKKILVTSSQQTFLIGFTNKETLAFGNLTYFAPEQILHGSLLAQTDIYSFSMVIYQALTGHLPFRDKNDLKEALAEKFSANVISLQHFNKILPKSLDSIFQKALAYDPKERYQTAKEFFDVLRKSLSTLAIQAKPVSELALVESQSKDSPFCVGLAAGSYYLEYLLGEGDSSWVYYGIDASNLSQRAFKIAKPPELVVFPNRSSKLTQEIEVVTGGLITQPPNIYQLFQFQVEKMQKTNDIALAKVDKLVHTNNICYYQMEFIKGQTLRELMEKSSIPIRVIIETALALERLSQNPNFRYHGDLKPENILVNETEIKFIDVGYFGCEEKTYLPTLITTPAYYPDLQADDLFALGLIVWEIVCHQQPFSSKISSSEFMDLSNIGENLFEWVYHSELVGQYFKSSILSIKHPSKIVSDIPFLLEDFLLKAINLYVRNDNKLDRKVHFKTFSQFASELETLLEAGITHL